MGKIFGISDNPVSIINSALKPLELEMPKIQVQKIVGNENPADKFVPKEKINSSNYVIKMRSGFGKLMSHFSRAKSN